MQDEDCLYTLPSGIFSQSLGQVFSDQSIPDNPETIQDDLVFNECSNVGVACPVQLFRVVSLNPSSLKILPSPVATATTDMVAIVPYSVEAREVNDSAEGLSLMVASGLGRTSGCATKIISTSSLMSVPFESVYKDFLKCSVDKLEYVFEGTSLPSEAYSEECRTLIKELVSADAIPGLWGAYVLPERQSARKLYLLNILCEAGLVKDLGETTFQITQDGMEHLRSRTLCEKFVQVLAAPVDKPLEDCTIWERMALLADQSWDAQPMPRRTPKALQTSGEIPSAERIYYYHPTK